MCVAFSVVTALVDEFPYKGVSRTLRHLRASGAICVICFLIGISCITRVQCYILIILKKKYTVLLPCAIDV